MHIGSCFFMGRQYNNDNSILFGGYVIKEKQTLFNYLYESLKEQILTGRLQYGEKIPSMNSLCEFYHLGIRTVKDVMRALKKDGYIITEERKAATVVYRSADREMAVRSALERKSSILAVHQTIAVLVPELLAFSARLYDPDKLSRLFHEQMKVKGTGAEAFMKVCDICIYALLENSNNLLFRDLYSSLEIYARMPFFQNHRRFVELVIEHNNFHGIRWVLESLSGGGPEEIGRRFHMMFQSVARAVEQYLNEMSEAYGEVAEKPEENYRWTAECGKEHYYVQIMRDLVRKIGEGVYQEGTYLPSESQLAAQYGVCVSTVRNAVSMLNRLGMGETLNAKGTRVTRQDRESIKQCIKSKSFRRDTLVYLSSLQLMAIMIRPAAAFAFEQITEEEKQELEKMCDRQETELLDHMVQCVIGHQPLLPYQAILQETRGLLFRGYYLSFLEEEPLGAGSFAQAVHTALACLAEGDGRGFSKGLSLCYYRALDIVRGVMMEYGLPGAEKIAALD